MRSLVNRLPPILLLLLACAPPDRPTVPRGDAPVRLPSPLENAGEAIYRRENCARCHTQFDVAPAAGPAALPGFKPAALFDARVGPDLGLEGHRRSDDWHFAHLYAPDVVAPGSRMPASRHLFEAAGGDRPRPGQEAVALVAYLQGLGRARRDVWAEFRSREPEVPAPAAVPEADRLDRGSSLYAAHCVACHGEAGDGRGPASGLLRCAPRDFTAGRYRFRSSPASERPRDADLFRSITLGTGTGAAMPGFHFLPVEERWALVLRIKDFCPSLRGTGLRLEAGAGRVADRAAETGDRPHRDAGGEGRPVEEGRALFAQLGCADCHGAAGTGLTADEAGATWTDGFDVVVPRSGDLTHGCARRGGGSDEAFARALMWGVGAAMPSYAAVLEGRPEAARALRQYLESAAAAAGEAPRPPP